MQNDIYLYKSISWLLSFLWKNMEQMKYLLVKKCDKLEVRPKSTNEDEYEFD